MTAQELIPILIPSKRGGMKKYLLILILLFGLSFKCEGIHINGYSTLGTVIVVSYSPDGKYIASGSVTSMENGTKDGGVSIRSAEDGKLIKDFGRQNCGVYSVSYSHDGKYIASGAGNTIKIWDAETGILIKTLEGHSSSVNSVSYSPDGKYIASGSSDNTVKIWDVETGSLIKTLAGHGDRVYTVSYSPDGKHVVSGGRDQTIKIWELEYGSFIATLEGHTGVIFSVTYSPDGKYIASGSKDHTIKIWDAETGDLIKTLEDDDEVYAVSYSPDGKYIVSGSKLKIWDAETGSLIKAFAVDTTWNVIWGISYSPDGKHIATGSKGEVPAVKIWNTPLGDQEITYSSKVKGADKLLLSSNNKGEGYKGIPWGSSLSQVSEILKGNISSEPNREIFGQEVNSIPEIIFAKLWGIPLIQLLGVTSYGTTALTHFNEDFKLFKLGEGEDRCLTFKDKFCCVFFQVNADNYKANYKRIKTKHGNESANKSFDFTEFDYKGQIEQNTANVIIWNYRKTKLFLVKRVQQTGPDNLNLVNTYAYTVYFSSDIFNEIKREVKTRIEAERKKEQLEKKKSENEDAGKIE